MPFVTLSLRRKIAGLGCGLALANVVAWSVAIALFAGRPALLGMAVLAYSLGLRHAVDADHIAAIDNVTRKLLQEGKRSSAVGFFFSLGHSTVVLMASIAATALASGKAIGTLHRLGGTAGVSVSAAFLFLIGAANLFSLASLYRRFKQARGGSASGFEGTPGGGFLARLLRPLFGVVGRSWHMYPLGLLFGLGFDTASEISLLGISAAEASQGISAAALLVFPALFTAGMSLVDTADGLLMLGVYDWAFADPIRRLYYNTAVTAISVIVAVAVGGIETLGLIAGDDEVKDGIWESVQMLNAHFGTIGFSIVSVFLSAWLGNALFQRLRKQAREKSAAALL